MSFASLLENIHGSWDVRLMFKLSTKCILKRLRIMESYMARYEPILKWRQQAGSAANGLINFNCLDLSVTNECRDDASVQSKHGICDVF